MPPLIVLAATLPMTCPGANAGRGGNQAGSATLQATRELNAAAYDSLR